MRIVVCDVYVVVNGGEVKCTPFTLGLSRRVNLGRPRLVPTLGPEDEVLRSQKGTPGVDLPSKGQNKLGR